MLAPASTASQGDTVDGVQCAPVEQLVPWTKNPRAIPLLPHEAIQLDIGKPVVPPQLISWAGTNL